MKCFSKTCSAQRLKCTPCQVILAAAVFFIAVSFAIGQTTKPALPAEVGVAQPPKVLALKFHADWCGSCKVLAPQISQAMAKTQNQPVLFMKFDLTDSRTRRQSEYLAASLGVGDLWPMSKKTGYVLLVNAETKQVIGKLTKAHDAAAMTKAISDAVAAAS